LSVVSLILSVLFYAGSASAASCVTYNMNRFPPRVVLDTVNVYPTCPGDAILSNAEIQAITAAVDANTAAIAAAAGGAAVVPDPAQFSAAFYWGMSTVLTFGMLGLAIGVAKSAIQKV